MSKSLKRVQADAERLGLAIDVKHMTVPTNTAAQAAEAIGAEVDQIVKSVIFKGGSTGKAILFLTAGAQRVDPAKGANLAGERLEKADAAFIRAETGFAIGGVSPIGHTQPVKAFLDRRVLDFETVWAAAGTPHHMFEISTRDLIRVTGAEPSDFTE